MLTMLGHSRTNNSSGQPSMSDNNLLISYSYQQLLELARKARQENRKMGQLWKRSSTNQLVLSALISDYSSSTEAEMANWKPKWLILYQNLLFIYASEREANGLSPPAHSKTSPPPRPVSVWLLEGCTCEKLLTLANTNNNLGAPQPNSQNLNNNRYWQHAFVVMFPGLNGVNNEAVLVLAASDEDDCEAWMSAIRDTQYWQLYNEYQVFKERYGMAARVLETERIAKWNYVVQLDEAHEEIKRLRWALSDAKCQARRGTALLDNDDSVNNNDSAPASPSSPQHQGAFGAVVDGGGTGDQFGLMASSSSSNRSATASAADDQLRKIKKAQSLMRGWLCRHRWKAIVDEYVRSPHAEKMKERNKIIFRLVKDEREYVDNLNALVSSFLRPLRMAASSSCGGGSSTSTCSTCGKSAACQHQQAHQFVISHEEVNAIFLNCQTLLFLHQIFLQGLSSALDRWPQLLIGDIFQLLLPALSVYTEYVRNHYVSVQTLAELKMNRPSLAAMIRQVELKQENSGDSRSLEVLLTYPMNHIPRYILNFHELLAYTPHNHIDRPKLEAALAQLEDLSLQMSTEMSESEHIRKNLSIERMIGEGGQVLLDPDEVLVRQGALLELDNFSAPGSSNATSSTSGGPGSGPGGVYLASIVQSLLAPSSSSTTVTSSSSFLADFKAAMTTATTPSNDKAVPRTVFLFSHYLIITSRSSNGKLSLVKHHGIIPLHECMLMESRSRLSSNCYETASLPASFPSSGSISSASSVISSHSQQQQQPLLDNEFSIVVDYRTTGTGVVITFVASNWREKQLWCSDIMQCLEKIRFDEIVLETRRYFNDTPSQSGAKGAENQNQNQLTTVQQTTTAIVAAAKLAKKGKNKEKTSGQGGEIVLTNSNSSAKCRPIIKQASLDTLMRCLTDFRLQTGDFINVFLTTYRLFTSGEAVLSELVEAYRHWKQIGEAAAEEFESVTSLTMMNPVGNNSNTASPALFLNRHHRYRKSSPLHFTGNSNFTGHRATTGSSNSTSPGSNRVSFSPSPASSRQSTPAMMRTSRSGSAGRPSCPPVLPPNSNNNNNEASSQHLQQIREQKNDSGPTGDQVDQEPSTRVPDDFDYLDGIADDDEDTVTDDDLVGDDGRRSLASTSDHQPRHRRRGTSATPVSSGGGGGGMVGSVGFGSPLLSSLFTGPTGATAANNSGKDSECGDGIIIEGRSSIKQVNAGMVVFSVANQRRRISSAIATQAFARATAGALDLEVGRLQKEHEKQLKADQLLHSAQCLNIFNIIRHWSIVYPEDFVISQPSSSIGQGVCQLLSEMACDNTSFTQQEGAAICKLLRHLTAGKTGEGAAPLKAQTTVSATVSLSDANRNWLLGKLSFLQQQASNSANSSESGVISLMAPPSTPMRKAAFNASTVFEQLPAIDIAEQMAYIDFTLFKSIKLSELMNQAWSKSATKERDAPTVTMITSHFNHMSLVVVTNIVSQASSTDRANAIKKWLLIASTCYAMHNYNGALQVVSALQSSPIYRLKKTWDKLNKQTRHCYEKMTTQLSAENRFKHLREELHQVDPPCVPYLGMYLQDLTLIEEGCPTFVSNYLVNFSKMKMIYQVISEIQSFQSVVYKIAVKQQVIDQLLDRSLALDDDTVYRLSLAVEPRQPQTQR